MSDNFFLSQRLNALGGISQRKVGNLLGMTDAAVGSWERFENSPRLTLAPRLAEVYRVSLGRMEREIIKLSREVESRRVAVNS